MEILVIQSSSSLATSMTATRLAGSHSYYLNTRQFLTEQRGWQIREQARGLPMGLMTLDFERIYITADEVSQIAGAIKSTQTPLVLVWFYSRGRWTRSFQKQVAHTEVIMNINEMHFIREILVTDVSGKEVPTMQASCGSTSNLHPIYKEVAFYDVDAVRALYHELGGSRQDGEPIGSTVILPHRSRWVQLWRLTAADVQVIDSEYSPAQLAKLRALGDEHAHARNRLMRDWTQRSFMDIEHLCRLREFVVTDVKGQEAIAMEFSYDNGRERTPRFFRVPQADMIKARAL
jgi:hypothetical protein